MYSINREYSNLAQINIDISLNTVETEDAEKKLKDLNKKNLINKKSILYRFKNFFILLNCLLALLIDGMLYINVESFFPLYVEHKFVVNGVE